MAGGQPPLAGSKMPASVLPAPGVSSRLSGFNTNILDCLVHIQSPRRGAPRKSALDRARRPAAQAGQDTLQVSGLHPIGPPSLGPRLPVDLGVNNRDYRGCDSRARGAGNDIKARPLDSVTAFGLLRVGRCTSRSGGPAASRFLIPLAALRRLRRSEGGRRRKSKKQRIESSYAYSPWSVAHEPSMDVSDSLKRGASDVTSLCSPNIACLARIYPTKNHTRLKTLRRSTCWSYSNMIFIEAPLPT
ncbi:hypothetical protein LZ32DRAFT_370126 [Colletotrichum eremochloae]|nr:hypothetical protein LZ32DRAFT_370126 [Colletotrichum eremochloae]